MHVPTLPKPSAAGASVHTFALGSPEQKASACPTVHVRSAGAEETQTKQSPGLDRRALLHAFSTASLAQVVDCPATKPESTTEATQSKRQHTRAGLLGILGGRPQARLVRIMLLA